MGLGLREPKIIGGFLGSIGICVLAGILNTANAGPLVFEGGVVNSASYVPAAAFNYGIAQGSIFAVFGANIGSNSPVVATSFPLTPELGGSSIQITVGGVTTHALVYYSTQTQIGAILPSSTPVGDGLLAVTYLGQTSAPVPVRIVSSAFGIYTVAQNGLGPVVVTDSNGLMIAQDNPARAGQVLTLWGTGLGPAPGDDASPPAPVDLPVNVAVLVGGKPAEVMYKGRSPCCAGLDQINFRVPAGVEGCSVSLTVTADGVPGNIGTLAVASGGGACVSTGGPVQRVRVDVDSTIRRQTIDGWEATSFSSQHDPVFPLFKDKLFEAAITDLGLTRVRVEIRAGAENVQDSWTQWRNGHIDDDTWRCRRYSTVNDDQNPFTINWAGFQFSELDATVEKIVLPLKGRAEAAGEKLGINVTYVAFTQQICDSSLGYHHTNPEEYAEFVLATYLHLRDKLGLVPDSWEVILEPDNTPQWRGGLIAQGIAAAARRLIANGFTPRFIAPSTASMANAPAYLDQMLRVPDSLRYLSLLSYHRYSGVSEAALRAIADRAARYGLKTGMLEHIGSGFADLHQDLEIGNNSAWQMYALAGTQEDGGAYFYIDKTDPSNPQVKLTRLGRLLRQYFRFIRPGAVRLGAGSSDRNFSPLAFVNADGKHVVVVKAGSGATFTILGLPAGTYGIKYSTETEYDMALPDVSIAAGEGVEAMIPGFGGITVYGK